MKIISRLILNEAKWIFHTSKIPLNLYIHLISLLFILYAKLETYPYIYINIYVCVRIYIINQDRHCSTEVEKERKLEDGDICEERVLRFGSCPIWINHSFILPSISSL